MKKYILMTAKVPGKFPRGKVALVELEVQPDLFRGWSMQNPFPKMISKRARGVKKIYKVWTELNIGKRCHTPGTLVEPYRLEAVLGKRCRESRLCAFHRGMAEALDLWRELDILEEYRGEEVGGG